MDPEIKENISNTNTWGRGLFMLLFGIIYSVAEIVLLAVVVIQFFFVLINNEKNARLLQFGKEISVFVYQVFLFLTFNSEEKPFPFADWPKEEEQKAVVSESESESDKSTDEEAKG